MEKTIYIFPNGNNVTFIGIEQFPIESWMQLLIKEIENNGFNPTEFNYKMPDGIECEVFKTECGYNWRTKTINL